MSWWLLPVLPLLFGAAGLLSQGRSRCSRASAFGALGLLAGLIAAPGHLPWVAPARGASAGGADDPHINEWWQAQPQLMAQALGALQPRVAGRTNVYAIAVAAQGYPPLFSREAQLALSVAAARFGGDYRGGVLLTNGLGDLMRHPLATQETIAVAARGVGERIDPARDLVIVYLASHGAPEAWISTNLHGELQFPPISSASLASSLSAAGITRRVVIVSACFSASWIPALASDDTIVIAAAAKDRTSFGCEESRRLTYFGEAFLEGPLARGASLRDAFDTARGTVTKWEVAEEFIPSMPQASIGKNLQSLWIARGARK